MKNPLPLVLALCLSVSSLFGAASPPRERASFDLDWRFHRGDAPGAEKPDFDAAAWRPVQTPHDYSIEREEGQDSIFDPRSPATDGGGYITAGIGWYRKTFQLPDLARGKRVFVEFEGVYMDSDVWINGRLLGNHPYGYTPFIYDLTPYLKADAPNVLAVRCNVEQPCSRWFSGAGIFRHVQLSITDPVHVAYDGTYVTTPEISADKATIQLRTTVANQGETPAGVTLRTIIESPDGKEIARLETQDHEKIEPNGQREFAQRITIPSPALWTLETPQLYSARTEIVRDGQVADEYRTPFGIRTIEFTVDGGFSLNGKHVPIRGVCNHHDQGCLGSAAFDRAIVRQLEILRGMGCNAIRTSHNPPSPALLDACDRLGFLVMDEAFDEWKSPKTKMGYGRFFDEWSERDIVNMLHRDRNHPSVILWSIGNEIPEQHSAKGGEMARRLAEFCRREDPTRLVTSACNNPVEAVKSGYADALDVLGINYHVDLYDRFKGQRKLLSSESASTVSTRGEYNLVERDGALVIDPRLNHQVSSYDVWRPVWAETTEMQLKKVADDPWIAGEFVWTGFDYIGEPTPYPWPAVSSYFGIVDLCGFPKDRYYLYQSRWTTQPMVHLLPHWNWPQFAGKPIPVWCYSNADTVELFLNGKSLGERKMADGAVRKFPVGESRDRNKKNQPIEEELGWYHAEWFVPFEPGELKAVARRAGQVVATDIVATVGKPAKIELTVDRQAIQAGGEDLAYASVKLVDAAGHVCPDADDTVKFQVEGSGRVAGVADGNPISHEEFQGNEHKAFHGLCLAVLRSAKEAGEIHLKASVAGLPDAEAQITVEPLPPTANPRL